MAVEKKVRQGIETLDPENFLPAADELLEFDLAPYLFKGLVLREKEFRDSLKLLDISQFERKFVRIHCSTDAIIPTWAYMLVAARLNGKAAMVSTLEGRALLEEIVLFRLKNAPVENYIDKRLVIKGCGKAELSEDLYVKLTEYLAPIARAVQFGEACSTVPVARKQDGNSE